MGCENKRSKIIPSFQTRLIERTDFPFINMGKAMGRVCLGVGCPKIRWFRKLGTQSKSQELRNVRIVNMHIL